MPEPTGREALSAMALDLATGGRVVEPRAFERALDQYETAHRAEVLREFAERIRTDAELDIDGLDDECCRNYGLAIARWMDSQAERYTAPAPR